MVDAGFSTWDTPGAGELVGNSEGSGLGFEATVGSSERTGSPDATEASVVVAVAADLEGAAVASTVAGMAEALDGAASPTDDVSTEGTDEVTAIGLGLFSCPCSFVVATGAVVGVDFDSGTDTGTDAVADAGADAGAGADVDVDAVVTI